MNRLVSQKDAAELLGVTERSIRSRVQRGLLHQFNVGRRAMYSYHELCQLKRALTNDNKNDRLELRIRKVEEDIQFMKFAMNISEVALTDPQAVRLLKLFVGPPTELEELRKLIGILNVLSVDNLIQMRMVSGDPDVWVVVYRAGPKINEIVERTNANHLKQLMRMASHNMRSVVLQYLEYYGTSTERAEFSKMYRGPESSLLLTLLD